MLQIFVWLLPRILLRLARTASAARSNMYSCASFQSNSEATAASVASAVVRLELEIDVAPIGALALGMSTQSVSQRMRELREFTHSGNSRTFSLCTSSMLKCAQFLFNKWYDEPDHSS